MNHESTKDEPLAIALTTIGVHTLAMILTAMLLAVLVYRVIGVGILRKAWINLDGIWAAVVLITGGFTLAMGFHQFVAG